MVPMNHLTKKAVTFQWGPKQQLAFEMLRQKLYEDPVLTLIDGVDGMVVYCDALIMGFVAILM